MDIQLLDIINVLTTPLAGIIGWLFGRRKQNNDFLKELQESINLLSGENKKLMAEVVELRKENVTLICNQESMKLEIERLRAENVTLRQEVELLNERLSNVKTITRKA